MNESKILRRKLGGGGGKTQFCALCWGQHPSLRLWDCCIEVCLHKKCMGDYTHTVKWNIFTVDILTTVKKYNDVELIKGSQLGVFFPQAIVYCYLVFKTLLSWKPEIVFNYTKRIIRAFSFAKQNKTKQNKKKSNRLLLFKGNFMSDARWFYHKKRKIGKGNLY